MPDSNFESRLRERLMGWGRKWEGPGTGSGPRMAFASNAESTAGDVLIVIFLRGAADGLNMIVPFGDEAYYRARPTLAIPRPDHHSRAANSRARDLDGFFGLHPAMASLQNAWMEKHLAVVHACGSPEDSHSHFRAMEYMERGVVSAVGPASGWINRHLASVETSNPSPLRALGWGESVQRSLLGSIPVTALQSISEAHLGGSQKVASAFSAMLSALYVQDADLGSLGRETLELLDALEKLNPDQYTPRGNHVYPESAFGEGLKQLAMLVKADVGLEAAALDLGGWDTHFAQGAAEGLMAGLLKALAEGLAAFHTDMVDELDRLIVVVMTEFGRRVAENASLGTDHGQGSVMMLLGGGVVGGTVHARWPGLSSAHLVGPGDLMVTTDYRDVLAEIIQLRLRNPAVSEIFPAFTPVLPGVVKPYDSAAEPIPAGLARVLTGSNLT